MAMPANEAQALASMIPPNPKVQGQMYTIPEALEVEPKLALRVKQDPFARDLLKIAQNLEGLTRHAGKHAAGVVISKGPLWDHVPCFLNEGKIVTQYEKDDAEEAGRGQLPHPRTAARPPLHRAMRSCQARRPPAGARSGPA